MWKAWNRELGLRCISFLKFGTFRAEPTAQPRPRRSRDQKEFTAEGAENSEKTIDSKESWQNFKKLHVTGAETKTEMVISLRPPRTLRLVVFYNFLSPPGARLRPGNGFDIFYVKFYAD